MRTVYMDYAATTNDAIFYSKIWKSIIFLWDFKRNEDGYR